MANNNIYEDHKDILDVVVLDNPTKGVQYRLTISEFRESYYIGVREWYASFENCFAPSNNGFNMPYNLHSCSALYNALANILTEAEVLPEVTRDVPMLRKAEAIDAISLKTAIPAEFLPEMLQNAEIDQTTNEITIKIQLPRGSEWLR